MADFDEEDSVLIETGFRKNPLKPTSAALSSVIFSL
jgi:hypothetical protein